MSNTLKGKFFNATRGMFGDNSVKYMDMDLALTSVNYDNSEYGFDWGNRENGSKLLASAILAKIATPTVARIYADKYTESVIQRFIQDSWSLEAIEVAKWINANTDHKIVIDEIDNENRQIKEEIQRLKLEKKLEEKAKEERKIQREKEFQQKIKEKLSQREREEEKRRKEDQKDATNRLNNYKEKITLYENEIKKQKITIKKQQNEIEKYKEFLNVLDIPALRKKFTTLDEIDI